MNQRSKGFTLIELLAVIVILAIIALIATPIILNIIEKSRKSAFVDTAYGLIEAAKLQYTQGILENDITEKNYTFPQGGVDKLEFSGGEPKGGSIKVTDDGKVSMAIHDGTWCVIKNDIESQVTITKYEEGTCVLPKELTPEKCFTFDSTTGTITDYLVDDEACGTDVAIPGSIGGVPVKVIGEKSFYQDGITSVDFSKLLQLQTIGNSAFAENQLLSVDLSDLVELQVIEDWAFDSNELTSVNFGNLMKLTTIAEGAFYHNQLLSADLSGLLSLTTIGDVAFYWNQLENLNLSNLPNLETIGEMAFYYNQLVNLEFNNLPKLQTMGKESFALNLLVSVDFINLPSLTTLGAESFAYNKITGIDLSPLTGLTTLGEQAFFENELSSLIIPSNVTGIGNGAFSDNLLSDDKAFIYARNGDGSIDTTKLVSYGGAKKSQVMIPDTVVIIGESAFKSCQITSVDFSKATKLQRIERFAFSTNQLTSVDLSELTNLTNIWWGAFEHNKLISVVIPSSVTTLDSSVFSYNQLTSVTIEGKSSSADFSYYGSSTTNTPFKYAWAKGYSDSNIIWNG